MNKKKKNQCAVLWYSLPMYIKHLPNWPGSVWGDINWKSKR